jgi:acyl CoA:acetate/3-ketoacid CoA transferase
MQYSAHYWDHREIYRFQVINVTDKEYYSSIADGNIVGSAGANTAYLGQPRTFMASLEVDYCKNKHTREFWVPSETDKGRRHSRACGIQIPM